MRACPVPYSPFMKWKYLTTEPIDSNAVSLIKYELTGKPCPHCERTYIKSHGYIYGYGDNSQSLTVRRIRFYCSNRGINKGCAKTFSVLVANRLKNSPTPLSSIYKFLQNLSPSTSIYHAFNLSPPCFSITSAYRYVKRWIASINHIKGLLTKEHAPPKNPLPPTSKALLHLKNWSSSLHQDFDLSCHASQFQLKFQRSFLL